MLNFGLLASQLFKFLLLWFCCLVVFCIYLRKDYDSVLSNNVVIWAWNFILFCYPFTCIYTDFKFLIHIFNSLQSSWKLQDFYSLEFQSSYIRQNLLVHCYLYGLENVAHTVDCYSQPIEKGVVLSRFSTGIEQPSAFEEPCCAPQPKLV